MNDEIERAICRLREAEIDYLIAHGWIRQIDAYKTVSGKLEDRWVFPKEEYVLSNKYQGITQGHAVNAQKAMSRINEYWRRPSVTERK